MEEFLAGMVMKEALRQILLEPCLYRVSPASSLGKILSEMTFRRRTVVRSCPHLDLMLEHSGKGLAGEFLVYVSGIV